MTYRAGSGGSRRLSIYLLRTPTIAAVITLGVLGVIGSIVVLALGASNVLELSTGLLVGAIGGVAGGLFFLLGGLVARTRRIEIEVNDATGQVNLSTRDLFTSSATKSVMLAEIAHLAITTPTDPDHAPQVVLVLIDNRTLSPTDSWAGNARVIAERLAVFLGKPLR